MIFWVNNKLTISELTYSWSGHFIFSLKKLIHIIKRNEGQQNEQYHLCIWRVCVFIIVTMNCQIFAFFRKFIIIIILVNINADVTIRKEILQAWWLSNKLLVCYLLRKWESVSETERKIKTNKEALRQEKGNDYSAKLIRLRNIC